MSVLQEQAVQMISELSDDNVSFLIEIIRRLMPQSLSSDGYSISDKEDGVQLFQKLEEARKEIQKYLPEDFDPDKELEEARAERYGCAD